LVRRGVEQEKKKREGKSSYESLFFGTQGCKPRGSSGVDSALLFFFLLLLVLSGSLGTLAAPL